MPINPITVAADNYNLEAGDSGWFEDTVDGLTAAAGSTYYTTKNSMRWIANGISNLGVAEENEQVFVPEDTGAALAAAGMEDAAVFYNNHRQGLDAVGLIASSMIPGTLGIKALNAASKSSRIMTELGLNVSALEKAREVAKASAGVGTGIFRPLHGDTLKAITTGFKVNAIETLAFETAALTTTIASPVYDQMDAGDMFYNTMVLGLGTGTAVGGLLSGIKTSYQVSKAAKAAGLAAPVIQTGSKYTEAADNLLVMKHSDAPESVVVPEIRRLAADDGAISSQLFQVYKRQTPDATASVFGFAKEVKRVADVDLAAKGELRQFMDLQTGMIADDAAALRNGLGDEISEKAMKHTVMPLRRSIAVMDSTSGKLVKSIDGNKPLAEATVAEAQAAWLSVAQLPLPAKGITGNDIPMLEKWVRASAVDIPVDGRLMGVDEGRALLQAQKQRAMQEIITNRGEDVATAQRILNLPETEARNAPLWHHDVMDAEGMQKAFMQPRYGAIAYDLGKAPKDALFTAQALKWAENANANRAVEKQMATAHILGGLGFPEAAAQLEASSYVKARVATASSASEAAGALTFANGSLDSITAWAQNTGRIVNKLTTELRTRNGTAIYKAIQPIMKDAKLSDELILAVNRLRLTDTHYVMHNGEMVRLDVALNRVDKNVNHIDDAVDSVKNPHVIPLSKEVAEFLTEHSRINLQSYRKPSSLMATANGYWDTKAHERYPELMPVYVPPVNLGKNKYFVLVRQDPAVFGADSSVSMITARSAEDLEKKIARAKNMIEAEGDDPRRYMFMTKDSTKAYFEAEGNYQYSRGINNSRVDSTLRRAGVLGDDKPLSMAETDGKAVLDMADDFLGWHGKMSARVIRDTIEMQYAEPLAMLEARGKGLLEMETAKAENITRSSVESIRNPYQEVIKTALDVSNFNEWDSLGWVRFNRTVEELGSKGLAAVRDAGSKMIDVVRPNGKIDEAMLDEAAAAINDTAKRIGMPGGYDAAAKHIHAESMAANPSFARAISRGNALVSLFALGMDAWQAINNAVGLAVMQNAEMGSVLNAIFKKNPEIAGQLAGVKMPGSQNTFIATAKLNSAAVKEFFSGGKVWEDGRWVQKTGKELLQGYEKEGLVLTELHQMRQIMDNLSFTGGESAAQLQKSVYDSIMQYGDMARTVTGNNFAEKFTRFVAAHAMRKITDVAMEQGIIKTEAEAMIYRNTAVNRIQGNMLASQRPVAFQGAAGQAIGLFMTYQVNLMQQLFRHVGGGDKVATGMLLGTQTALYGMQGLPGWNLVNTMLVADAAGNTGHSDLYAAVNSATGKETADWLLYGLGSNLLGVAHPDLKVNLYTRGDINPRTLTVLPTNVEETILYKTTLGFIGNLFETAKNIGNGAPLDQAFYQGLQHNGINRPLAGMGAILAGATYTSDGKMIAPVDEQLTTLSISNTVRLMGAKPLDDAITADALFRTRAFDAADKEKRDSIAEAVRLEAADGTIDPEKIPEFAAAYAKTGGNPEAFRRFLIGKLKDQEQTIVEQSAARMREPIFQNFSAIIGADEPDFEWKRRQQFGGINLDGEE